MGVKGKRREVWVVGMEERGREVNDIDELGNGECKEEFNGIKGKGNVLS